VRAFVAVFPPPEVQEALHRAALALPASEAFRLTAPERIHLTLKFLGEVPEETLVRTRDSLGPVCEGREPFEVETSGFGVFPSERRARILWAGVGEGSGRLRDLARDVESTLATVGFEREARPYLPHLTLGRVRGRPVGLDAGGGVRAPRLRFTIRALDLVKSVPGGGGVTYSGLASFLF
jgi:RNA 2',3'-cyclic 3'-phosphodiesterase